MATEAPDPRRLEAEEEYRAWARICEDKHGLPWPILEDAIPDSTTSRLLSEIKKLRTLGRTPHE